jgi:tetratricopeptide (TPR) repeat protein
MWYLIIPPIIVVISLSFVLWYLSRKGADPAIAKKVLGLEEEVKKRVSFPRAKTFFLRLLEKMAYSFKVKSLKAHNTLHNLTHAIKEKQRRFQAKVLKEESFGQKQDGEQPVKSPMSFWRRYKKDKGDTDEEEIISNVSVKEIVLETPIARKQKKTPSTEMENIESTESEESVLISRPMVSEKVVHPERELARARENSFREADIIARITANPRDFAAYEDLGDYYLEIGNLQDAKECYRQVLKLSPAERMVRIKIRRLEKILSQEVE